MELVLAIVGAVLLALVARWAHKRAEPPPPQTHSPAKRDLDHDPKEIAGWSMSGYSADR